MKEIKYIDLKDKRYRKDLYDKAVRKMKEDECLKKEIEELKFRYINRWYSYFICEERMK